MDSTMLSSWRPSVIANKKQIWGKVMGEREVWKWWWPESNIFECMTRHGSN